MQLKVTERNGKREWVTIMDDEEMYEVVCDQIAWKTIVSERVLKLSDDNLNEIQALTVTAVKKAAEPESAKHVVQIQNPFIKLVLCECNRLKIELP